MRAMSAAETAPTLHPWPVHAKGLRVRAADIWPSTDSIWR